eukprot:scaffold466374_cov18-Prasinocladus_malaysianus.AAC.1
MSADVHGIKNRNLSELKVYCDDDVYNIDDGRQHYTATRITSSIIAYVTYSSRSSGALLNAKYVA